jgi:hypothetical protein
MDVIAPLQIVRLEGVAVVLGIGVTVTMTVIGDPKQPLEDVGVIVYVAVPGTLPLVIKVWVIDVPLPLDAPVTPFSSTIQLNVVPDRSELRAISVVLPLHIFRLEGVAMTFGFGLTVTTTVMGDPMHPFEDVGVII